jgi:hypothetical protein
MAQKALRKNQLSASNIVFREREREREGERERRREKEKARVKALSQNQLAAS